MAREPEERYATAKEMAEDLQRFAAGRLVQAHAYTARELVNRWVARRKAILAVAAVAVVVLVVFGGVAVRRITRERDAARAAREEAEARRAEAVLRRDAAEKLIDSLVGDFRQKLVPIGKLDVMSALGGSVVDYYRSVPMGDDVDAATLARRAKALGTLAGVADIQHNVEPAIREYQEAIALCERALAKDAAVAEAKVSRAWFLYRIGFCEMGRYKTDVALEYYQRACWRSMKPSRWFKIHPRSKTRNEGISSCWPPWAKPCSSVEIWSAPSPSSRKPSCEKPTRAARQRALRLPAKAMTPPAGLSCTDLTSGSRQVSSRRLARTPRKVCAFGPSGVPRAQRMPTEQRHVS